MNVFQKYFRLIVLNLILTFVLRVIETVSIFFIHGILIREVLDELLGWILDVVLTNIVLLPAFGLYIILWKRNQKRADMTFVVIFFILSSIHLIILKYFLYQLIPLDIFIFQYSLREILFTIGTSRSNYITLIAGIFLLSGGIYILYRWVSEKHFTLAVIKRSYQIYSLLLIVAIFISFGVISSNSYLKNKSIYFYYRSVQHLIKSNGNAGYYDQDIAGSFYSLFGIREPLDPDFPLLHTFYSSGSFDRFFKKADSIPPNFVIIIVEGLNDDFIHPYKGVDLMPFLSELKDKGLYWKNCLALGERSFAAVPSVIGGLPHGTKGFTLLNQLPYHHTLVSVLGSANYYTTFFYGQGSWFHEKDRFFKYNNIDLIFDKDRFSDEYDKVITGKDQFFWGYNDKDLFQQSLKVIDTLPSGPRLDIYFTGSTHSPFAISEDEHYSELVNNYIQTSNNEEDKNFFSHYKKYIQSIVYLDDALKDFIVKYESGNDFENTIFIITGDHPMTELPLGNSLKKYHVPLIIYSPLLIQAETFSGVVSQLDLYETILGFLSTDYNVKVPPVSASLGKQLTFSDSSENKTIVFMNDNRELVELYSNGYYLSKAKVLYKVENDFTLRKIYDQDILKHLTSQLEVFQKVNYYVCMENKILPDSLYYESLGYSLVHEYKNITGTAFNTEYHPVTDKVLLQNKKLYCDFSLLYKGVKDEETSIVYQLSGANDSVIFWKNIGLARNKTSMQYRAVIPKQNISADSVWFNSYFWNKNKQKIKYRNLTTNIYTGQ